jgi:lipopolysaccharide export system protein LptA
MSTPRIIFLSFFISVFFFASLRAQAFEKTNLKDLKILSAEKLDYKDGNSILIGNVKIKMGNYIISAPKVFVDADTNGQPALVRFVEDAFLESKDLKIKAPEMFFDVKSSIFNCFGDDEVLVETKIIESEKEMLIYSWYQEYDLNTETASVSAFDENKSPDKKAPNDFYKRVHFFRDKLKIISDKIEITNKKGKTEFVDFLGDVVAIDPDKRIESKSLVFFPANSMLKASDDVKVLYYDEKKPTYLFADIMIYEDKEKILTALSNSFESQSEVHSQNTFGKSRQITMTLNKENKPDNAILTGNAFAQHSDKSMLGHEILFDIQNQTIKTLAGRPKTQIFKNR